MPERDSKIERCGNQAIFGLGGEVPGIEAWKKIFEFGSWKLGSR